MLENNSLVGQWLNLEEIYYLKQKFLMMPKYGNNYLEYRATWKSKTKDKPRKLHIKRISQNLEDQLAFCILLLAESNV